MLAEVLWSLGIVGTLTGPIHQEVLGAAVALTRYFGLAIWQQLDIPIEHDCYRFLYPAITLW